MYLRLKRALSDSRQRRTRAQRGQRKLPSCPKLVAAPGNRGRNELNLDRDTKAELVRHQREMHQAT